MDLMLLVFDFRGFCFRPPNLVGVNRLLRDRRLRAAVLPLVPAAHAPIDHHRVLEVYILPSAAVV